MWELRREHTVNSKCKNNYLERKILRENMLPFPTKGTIFGIKNTT